MSELGWVGPAVLAVFLLASLLAGFRIFTLQGGIGKGAGIAYFVLVGSLVAFAATAGVMYWKRQMTEAMAPEK